MLIVNDFTPTTLAYLMPFRKRHFYIYVFVLLLVTCCIAVLPFVSTTISVNAQGITRPEKERTEVKNVVGGIIDKIYYKEGDTIAKGAVLLRIKDNVLFFLCHNVSVLLETCFDNALYHSTLHHYLFYQQ